MQTPLYRPACNLHIVGWRLTVSPLANDLILGLGIWASALVSSILTSSWFYIPVRQRKAYGSYVSREISGWCIRRHWLKRPWTWALCFFINIGRGGEGLGPQSRGQSSDLSIFNCLPKTELSLIILAGVLNLLSKKTPGDFRSGPVAKTLSSQCRGPRFHPWIPVQETRSHMSQLRVWMWQLRPGTAK